MTTANAPSARPAHLGWCLLSLTYDALPVMALWLALSAVVLLLDGGRPLAPWSLGQILLWLGCWALAGAYAVMSWRRGGQTLGMRPWQLRIVSADGQPAGLVALCRRYLAATLSLAIGGAGFWWMLIDRDSRSWHDRLSGTRLVRLTPAAD